MPNWCWTSHIIEGEPKTIKNLWDKLETWSQANYVPDGYGFGPAWLGNILIGAGLMDKNEECQYRHRGFLENEITYAENDDGTAYISFATEDAWAPQITMWRAIIDQHAPGCKHYFCAEETGMCLFINSDKDHKYFDEEFYVDTCFDEPELLPTEFTSYFQSYEHQYDWTEDELRIAIQHCLRSDETDLDTLIEQINDYELEGDNFLFISRYETEYEE